MSALSNTLPAKRSLQQIGRSLSVEVDLPVANEHAASCASPKMLSEIHRQQSPPYAFLEEAARHGADANYFDSGITSFGLQKEAFVREAYMDITDCIEQSHTKSKKKGSVWHLVVIRGSSGVGKSVFLGYLLAMCRLGGTKNFAIFHAGKDTKSGSGAVDFSEVDCSLWLDGTIAIKGKFADVKGDIRKSLSKVSLIILDGCSLPLGFQGFRGLVVLSASPSQYVKNLQDHIQDHVAFTMPSVPFDESMEIADHLQVDRSMVEDNFEHMNGIARYLFQPGAAKEKVDESILSVDPENISDMVTMQSASKNQNQVAVHSLVLWNVNVNNKKYEVYPTFSMVSRYAEKLVAKKLARTELHLLKATQSRLSSVSGASGYAGAMFEAYAIRVLQNEGSFPLRPLDVNSGSPAFNLVLAAMDDDQVVEVEGNELTKQLLPFQKLNKAKPLLLWPTTTNFPSFDCFYFYDDDTVYCLQMTISLDHDLKNSGAKTQSHTLTLYLVPRSPRTTSRSLSCQRVRQPSTRSKSLLAPVKIQRRT